MKVGFVSLGCSKNLIDTEIAIGVFKNHSFQIVSKPQDAEVIVVNTCGFIEPAKQEAIDTILEMAEYKVNGKCKYIIVMGCLVQRYREELEKNLPEVDLFITIDEYENFWNKIGQLSIEKKDDSTSLNKKEYCFDYENRIITTGNKTAYLKIAEGCSNRCTYCAIPYIRGPYISRKIEDILKEAESLAEKGFKEIIVIAQDTTKYGIDIYGKPMLAKLLEELAKIKEFEWIRFLYAYPESITDELIDTVGKNDNICNYFDIPIQHISNKILKLMNRPVENNRKVGPNENIQKLIEKLRAKIPDVILRTSLIVGFPEEDENDFNMLYNFVSEAKFDKLGVFTYSKEDGTPASRLKGQIHHATKKRRYNKIMKLAKEIVEEKTKSYIGKIYKVLIEYKTFDNKYYVGRGYMDIPDTDGVTFIKNTKPNLEGEFVECKIIDTKGYDLISKILK